MSYRKHIDFEPTAWRELAEPPTPWRGYAQQVLAFNPEAYWRLGDASGQPAEDQTGQHDGVYVGGTTHDQAGALFRDDDTAVRFNGSNSSAEVAGSTLLNGATACTLIFWMYFHGPSVTKDYAVISHGSGPPMKGWHVWIDHTGVFSGRQRTLTFSINYASTTTRVEGSTDLVTPGGWDCFACTFEAGTSLRIYKNGQLDQQNATPITALVSTTDPLLIGRPGYNYPHLDASLDEIAVFDYALSASQIADLYHLGIGQLRLPQSGAVV